MTDAMKDESLDRTIMSRRREDFSLIIKSPRLVRKFYQLYDDALELFESLPQYPMVAREEHELTLPPLFSWGRYISRGLVAVRALDNVPDAGLFSPPLWRSIIEHAVTLTAVATDPEIYAVQARKMKSSAEKQADATAAIGLEVPQELAYAAAIEVSQKGKSKDYLRNFNHLCKHLGDEGLRFYLDWLDQTQLSHAGFLTSVAYLVREKPDAPTLMLNSQYPPRDPLRDAALAADVMILTDDRISSVLKADPLRQKVYELNTRKGQLLYAAGVRIDRSRDGETDN